MLSRFLEFLFSLNRVHITSGTRFSFVWNYPAVIILGAIALALIGYFSYRPQAADATKKRAMASTRALLLVVLWILVFRPQLVLEREERTRSVVAIWVDSSASMSLEDPYNAGTPAASQPASAYSDAAMRDFMQKIA